jgi:hypothetical protein
MFKPVRVAPTSATQSAKGSAEKQVKEALASIERAELIPGFDLVKDGIREQLKDRARTRASIEEDGLSPDGLIYLLASNIANTQLCTGNHHIYRGVLSMSGKQLLAAFGKASEMMVHCGIHSKEEHERELRSLKKEISEIG